MGRLADREVCTGCGACADACPHDAVRMAEDADGFSFPAILEDRCVSCGVCTRACPALTPPHTDCAEPPTYFAARLKDAAALDCVSSGGAFWAFATVVLERGGVVFGACQESVACVRHVRAETESAARALRRSKYLPSDMSGVYRAACADLRAGRTVLFSGTGCQVAAMRLAAERIRIGRLVTCEVVCHGIPSMKVWRTYLAELERREKSAVSGVVFRDKSRGWRQNRYRIAFADGHEACEPSVCHPFHLGYLLGLFWRRSCGRCASAGPRRVADLTLADFWKYPGGAFSADLEKGVSLVVASTCRGRELIDAVSDRLAVEPVTREAVLASCPNFSSPPRENPNRSGFLALLDRRGYREAARFYLRYGADRRPGRLARWSLFLGNLLRRRHHEAVR